MAHRARNLTPNRQRKALLSVDLMLYTGNVQAVRDFVGTSAKVIQAARGFLVLDCPSGPLTVGPGDCITRNKANRLSVSKVTNEDDETP